MNKFLYNNRESLWRGWSWLCDWLRLFDTVVSLVTLGMVRPCYYGKAFDWLLDRGWM